MKILATILVLYTLCLFPKSVGELPHKMAKIHNPAIKSFSNEVKCLAATLYVEARGEGTTGMLGVANVVLNRSLRHKQSVCNVVAKKGQFQWYKGTFPTVPRQYTALAEQFLMKHLTNDLEDVTNGAMFFMHNRIRNNVTKKHKLVFQHRNHSFYK
jgi:spore germination cell wall hydrolase CwlJ-like protein